ncbi:hypothetical protein [Brevibacillus laterosporus]|nr:hypothetical protein [Brevibacillus laterosporus]
MKLFTQSSIHQNGVTEVKQVTGWRFTNTWKEVGSIIKGWK